MSWKWWTLGFLLVCAACIAVALMIYEAGAEAGRDEVRVAWEQQRKADAAHMARLAQQARENEQGLQRAADQIRRTKDAEISRLDAAHAAAVRELRKRASRPADYMPAAPQVAGTGPAPSCSADQLFREDAAAALGIAADADTVRASLTECRAQYEAAQKAME
jgi:hypothetical protein